ncbi:uncharacterized protein TRIADDRAFT_51626 [Trichoplax adhaerens]|uniref:Uncharacterized protein n=1 Tax=Trichoplax adhaerens TaxID=10228 RepID=B3RK51_TRIAD|nr:predicted protein [Trichoplax adhaerens]EDV29379.1 predicted protein [Trichoplax adhaerens]|eukprot:XP_002108581.1 predicted protein [Trichoplax adhaerens]
MATFQWRLDKMEEDKEELQQIGGQALPSWLVLLSMAIDCLDRVILYCATHSQASEAKAGYISIDSLFVDRSMRIWMPSVDVAGRVGDLWRMKAHLYPRRVMDGLFGVDILDRRVRNNCANLLVKLHHYKMNQWFKAKKELL